MSLCDEVNYKQYWVKDLGWHQRNLEIAGDHVEEVLLLILTDYPTYELSIQ